MRRSTDARMLRRFHRSSALCRIAHSRAYRTAAPGDVAKSRACHYRQKRVHSQNPGFELGGEIIQAPTPSAQGGLFAFNTEEQDEEAEFFDRGAGAVACCALFRRTGGRQDVLLGLAWRSGRSGLDLLPGRRQAVGKRHRQHRQHLVPQWRRGLAAGSGSRRHRRRGRRHRHDQPRSGQPGRDRQGGQRGQHPDHQLQHARPDGQLRRLCRRRQRHLRQRLGAVPRRQGPGEEGRLRLDAGRSSRRHLWRAGRRRHQERLRAARHHL